VPTVCSFAGIVVAMYYNDHNPPHFHARSGNGTVVIEVQGPRVYKGSLPTRQLDQVLNWAADHRDELMRNWELARQGRPIDRIDPPPGTGA
jgi:Domain of unknown function (DUF4160)